MNYTELEEFLKRVAPDVDTGWQWLREMHDLGYEYDAHKDRNMSSFGGPGLVSICLVYFAGKVVWVPSWHGRSGVQNDANGYRFETPMAAHAWMKVEQSNEPAAEVTMDPTKKASQIPWPGGIPPAAPMPQPMPSNPFSSIILSGGGIVSAPSVPIAAPQQPWPVNPAHGTVCNGHIWDDFNGAWCTLPTP